MGNIKSKGGLFTLSFLFSVIFTAEATVLIKNYIPFLETFAGTYPVAFIGGEPLRAFLFRIILIIGGLIAFAIFMTVGIKKYNKSLFPYFTIFSGIFDIIFPIMSAYTISRFTGYILPQTVTSVAVIANVVFMTIALCFGIIAIIDFIRQTIKFETETKGTVISLALAGVPVGYGFAMLIGGLISNSVGIVTTFILVGVLVLCIGVATIIPCVKKLWNKQQPNITHL